LTLLTLLIFPNSWILRSLQHFGRGAGEGLRENRAEADSMSSSGLIAEATVQSERRCKTARIFFGALRIQRHTVLTMLAALNPTPVFPLRK
jgi:hypothetical protein